jgi:hypothetical protein
MGAGGNWVAVFVEQYLVMAGCVEADSWDQVEGFHEDE